MWGYIKAHWQGRLGLLRSTLLNGVVGYLLLTIGTWLLVAYEMSKSLASQSKGPFLPHPDFPELACPMGLPVWLLFGVAVLWGIWASDGIVRCGARYAQDKTNTSVRRVAAVICMEVGALVGAKLIYDVLQLLRDVLTDKAN